MLDENTPECKKQNMAKLVFKIVLVLSLLVLTVGLITFLVFESRVNERYTKTKADAAAAGIIVNPEVFFESIKVKPEENGAEALRAVMEKISAADEAFFAAEQKLIDEKAASVAAEGEKTETEPVQVEDVFWESPVRSIIKHPELTARRLAALQPLLAELQNVIHKYPHLLFVTNAEEMEWIFNSKKTPMSTYPLLRDAANLLALQAIHNAKAGQVDAAISNIKAMLTMSASHVPTSLFEGLDAMVNDYIAVTTATELAWVAPINEAQARNLAEAFSTHANRHQLFRQALKGELVLGSVVLTEMFNAMTTGEDPKGIFGNAGMEPFWMPIPQAFLDNEQEFLIRFYLRMIALVGNEYQDVLVESKKMDQEFKSMSEIDQYLHWLNLMALPGVDSVIQAHYRRQSSLAATVVAFSAYADKLAGKELAYDSSWPVDPLSGKPFALDVKGGWLRVVSLGQDGKADEETWTPPALLSFEEAAEKDEFPELHYIEGDPSNQPNADQDLILRLPGTFDK